MLTRFIPARDLEKGMIVLRPSGEGRLIVSIEEGATGVYRIVTFRDQSVVWYRLFQEVQVQAREQDYIEFR